MVWCHFALACQSFCKKVRHKHKVTVSLPFHWEEPVLLSHNPEHQRIVCPRRPGRGKKMRKYAEKSELHLCQPGPLWLQQHSSWCLQPVCDFFQNIFHKCVPATASRWRLPSCPHQRSVSDVVGGVEGPPAAADGGLIQRVAVGLAIVVVDRQVLHVHRPLWLQRLRK